MGLQHGSRLRSLSFLPPCHNRSRRLCCPVHVIPPCSPQVLVQSLSWAHGWLIESRVSLTRTWSTSVPSRVMRGTRCRGGAIIVSRGSLAACRNSHLKGPLPREELLPRPRADAVRLSELTSFR